MKLEISLAPSGDIRLHLPSGRTLDVGDTVASLQYIRRIIRSADAGERDQHGHIGLFPTQAIIDAWKAADDTRKIEEGKRILSEDLGLDINALELRI